MKNGAESCRVQKIGSSGMIVARSVCYWFLSYSKRSSIAIHPISLQITVNRLDQPSVSQQFKQPSRKRSEKMRALIRKAERQFAIGSGSIVKGLAQENGHPLQIP